MARNSSWLVLTALATSTLVALPTAEAQDRAARVSNVRYDLTFAIPEPASAILLAISTLAFGIFRRNVRS